MSWLALIAFGAFHGLNPGMGWLFALSVGLQRQNARAVGWALFPIALGHAVSVALVAGILLAGAQVVPVLALRWATALLLLGFGAYKAANWYRHPRWVGMKVGFRDLTLWSFLMATAHGAGLMIAPVLLGLGGEHAHAEHIGTGGGEAAPSSGAMAIGVGLHTLAMFAVMGLVAFLVYKFFGLAVLRSRWINFDLIWAISLIAVGTIALAMSGYATFFAEGA